jgi:hypothetical protein
MRHLRSTRKPYWEAFLRTPLGRDFLRLGVIRRPYRKPLPRLRLARRDVFWLAAAAAICLFGLLLGAWLSWLLRSESWGDD